MKFAKVLFFICAIGLCTAAERSTAEIAAEYRAETEALKVEVGYKEMFVRWTPPAMPGVVGLLDVNYPAKISVSGEQGQVIDATFQAQLLKNGFASGIPFFSKNWAALNKGAFKHLVKSNDNVYYLPFNTINSVKTDEETIMFVIDNKFGPNTIIMNLPGVGDKTPLIKGQIDTKQTTRQQHVRDNFQRVQWYAYYAKDAQEKIKKAQDSDAKKKTDMQTEITKLKTQLAQLKAKLVTLKTLQVTQSQSLQTSETKLSETTTKKTKKITEKISIEKTIKTLESKVSPQEVIKKLQADKEEAKKNLEYWLKGAVYHRVINESEKTGLLGMALQNDAFDKKVNDYFFPQ